MKTPSWKIRPQYISLVKRFENEKDVAKKIEMKHKFASWLGEHHYQLSDAELEYLQTCICPVEDILY